MSTAPADELDTVFNVSFSTFAILIVFSRSPSSASSVVTATVCPDGVVIQRDPSRNMLFDDARLLIPDFTVHTSL